MCVSGGGVGGGRYLCDSADVWVYYRSGFNCEYLLITNFEFFYVLQLIDSQSLT